MTGSSRKLRADIFRQGAKFFAGASKQSALPRHSLPEIAFIGKSNVGKSSLINALCNHKGLARISNTPGRTRQINFFSVADKLALVDLPGYGYAKVSKTEQAQWEKLIVYYLQNSENLRLVNILIDARRGLKADDIYVINLMREYKRQIQIVATKVDKKDAIVGLDVQIGECLGGEYSLLPGQCDYEHKAQAAELTENLSLREIGEDLSAAATLQLLQAESSTKKSSILLTSSKNGEGIKQLANSIIQCF